MKQVLPAIEELINRLRARQMAVEITVLELVRLLPAQARETFADDVQARTVLALQQHADKVSPGMEEQIAALLAAVRLAAGDPPANQ